MLSLKHAFLVQEDSLAAGHPEFTTLLYSRIKFGLFLLTMNPLNAFVLIYLGIL
jgi:hypothetical protein